MIITNKHNIEGAFVFYNNPKSTKWRFCKAALVAVSLRYRSSSSLVRSATHFRIMSIPANVASSEKTVNKS